jgi:chloramphenicol O-acetyltransferase type A
MKKLVELNDWIRKEHYQFFSKFEEPFFGITSNVDCTKAYFTSKEKGNSFFLYYLFRALKAANHIENFRYRIIDQQIYLFDQIHASPTINRPNGTFGFSYLNYFEDENLFYENAKREIETVKNGTGLFPAMSGENVIHFSSIPWINFTSVSHARSFTLPDSCPKISFGKISEKEGIMTMSVSIHVHHGLMDGLHVGMFLEQFQRLLND